MGHQMWCTMHHAWHKNSCFQFGCEEGRTLLQTSVAPASERRYSKELAASFCFYINLLRSHFINLLLSSQEYYSLYLRYTIFNITWRIPKFCCAFLYMCFNSHNVVLNFELSIYKVWVLALLHIVSFGFKTWFFSVFGDKFSLCYLVISGSSTESWFFNVGTKVKEDDTHDPLFLQLNACALNVQIVYKTL